jgi:hypothetical protein
MQFSCISNASGHEGFSLQIIQVECAFYAADQVLVVVVAVLDLHSFKCAFNAAHLCNTATFAHIQCIVDMCVEP